jgi:alpha/beta hydrolase fold
MTDQILLSDHTGVRLTHGKPKVNGVEIHYAIGGAGEPVFLLHGVPKTMSYWRHVVPLLTPHYTVVAVDNRGFGGSQRPPAGYDTATMAGDVAELATPLTEGDEQGKIRGYTLSASRRLWIACCLDLCQVGWRRTVISSAGRGVACRSGGTGGA